MAMLPFGKTAVTTAVISAVNAPLRLVEPEPSKASEKVASACSFCVVLVGTPKKALVLAASVEERPADV